MSSRVNILILFALLPVLASGRGGGGRGGGRGSRGRGSHSYPSGPGLSGNSHPSHNYPHSGTGLSGNSRPRQTELHHHYHYRPPTHVYYGSSYHPVYQGMPPVYVYSYRDSGSRYNYLLTGLALYNLGRMSSHHDSHYYSNAYTYRGRSGEYCELQIIRTDGEYERTKIGCQLMSSFILDAEHDREQELNRVVSTDAESVIAINITDVESLGENDSEEVVTTVQNTTEVLDAFEAKGPSIEVTPDMDCYMVRTYRDSTIKKKVDCGLLQQYAIRSFRNSSMCNVPILNIIILMLSILYLAI